MNIDFLIIGQGLAGTVLSHTLKNRGKPFLFIDEGLEKTASNAAAGIFNPITGRQMRKTWIADELFNYLPGFYKNLENHLKTEIIHFMPVLRMFDSQKQVNDWYAQMEKPGFEDFLDLNPTEIPDNIKAPLGLYATKKSGYVNVPLLVNTYRNYLLRNNLIVEKAFQFDKLEMKDGKAVYGEIVADKVIFCEGAKLKSNPLFNYLPLVPNKGEILEVEFKKLTNKFIYNKNGFMMPRKDQKFWVGATYKRNSFDTEPSEEGLKELHSKIAGITDEEYKVKGAHVGIRPTVRDRKPLIGLHPKNEQIGIFNGLGSKGVSLAPYWANAFAEFLCDKKELPPDVNIARYNSLI